MFLFVLLIWEGDSIFFTSVAETAFTLLNLANTLLYRPQLQVSLHSIPKHTQ